MTRFSPLLTVRWLFAALLVIAAAVSCVLLGRWQFERYEEKSRIKETIERTYDARPVTLSSVLPATNADLPATDDYSVVAVRGEYCVKPECSMFVRNRTLNSSVGYWQLVPFVTTEGSTLLTVRGWVPASNTKAAPAVAPTVPRGQVDLVARLRPDEPYLANKKVADGQIVSVNRHDVHQVAGPLRDPYENVYAVMATENGKDSHSAQLMPLERPETSLGPHLSYAFQWWIFSVFFPLGLIVAARRTLRDEAEAAAGAEETRRDAASAPRGASPTRGSERYQGSGRPQRRTPRRISDEDEEDAFLDERRIR